MKYYLAPMEGITGYIYRSSYEKFFNNIDKYFTPFIVPNKSTSLKTKELRDILPENNIWLRRAGKENKIILYYWWISKVVLHYRHTYIQKRG